MIKILNVIGVRPNFMKVAPLHRAFLDSGQIESKIVHTGQHYDEKMSDVFFNQLELPNPHFYLGVGGGSHTYQKANVMLRFEKVVKEEDPDLVLVVGDVNATAACSIVAVKMGIPVAHVEAGLRSGDRRMPEEINRIITDSISDFLFVTEYSGLVNLSKEGVDESKVFYVGNVMIDSLLHFKEKADRSTILEDTKLRTKEYILLTIHRPQNVDNENGLRIILEIIKNACQYHKVVFPIHPRTLKNLRTYQLYQELEQIDGLTVLDPQGYLEFLKLMDNACLIITDSGGIQEETTFLQVPCITFRSSTERPVTVELGTNFLMQDLDPKTVSRCMESILSGQAKRGSIPPLWDGKTANRICQLLIQQLKPQKQSIEASSQL